MSENKIKLSDATEEQLRRFAENYLGMTFPGNTKADTIRAKVAAAWSKDEILIAAEEQPEAEQQGSPPRPVTAGQQLKPDKVRLILQRTDDAGGDEPVPVGVNGRVMLIPRGEEVDIPPEYFEVLKHAVTHRYESLPDGGINPIARKVPLYPYQRIA